MSDDDFEDLHDRLSEVFEEVRKKINEVGEGEWQHIGHDTSTDPVIAKLEPALTGRVGPSFSPEDRAALTALCHKRVDQRVPPGYMDAKKDGNGAVGDFFVWEQLLREASRRQCDVLFVTADAKEDWWRKERGHNRGLRPELTAELRARGGGRLYLLSPKQFLEVAAPVLRLSLQAGSVEPEAVYDLCDYDDDRTLRGFTKPITRISRKLQKQGLIPDSAVPVLTAEYKNGPGRTSGFRVHPLLAPLINDAENNDEDS
ncbi:PIN-like domain-containing protein [Streptomyces sp. NPDC014764]|uniref:PIN-like domain-containing protein n=1 Tax=Streptomyces sp. NPDC014764 TaxID=3364907 RepID=UPI003701ED82